MSDPMIAGRTPIPADVEAGKSYFWCACGRSNNQPFCDGSHKGTDFTPMRFDATETRRVWFCACKRTGNQPMCDGTHNRLDE